MAIDFATAYGMATRSKAQKPRIRALLGGTEGVQALNAQTAADTPMPFCKSASVQRNNAFAHDRFKATFALTQPFDYEWWAKWAGLAFDLELGYEGGPFVGVFHGVADKLECDSHRGEIYLTGRNSGSVMNNAQARARSYTNEQTKTLVENLAGEYGFAVEWGETEPDGDFGVEVKGDKAHQALGYQTGDITDWDILARIAMQTGRSLYEKNGKIYMHLKKAFEQYYIIAPTRNYSDDGLVCKLGPSNSTSLKFFHDYAVTNYGQYVLTNHNFHGPTTTMHKYPPDEAVAEGEKKAPAYVVVANKTVEDADDFIKSYQSNTGTREWRCEWTSSGAEMLDIDVIDQLIVSGTNSDFDGPYQIISLEHNIHFERGLSTTVVGEWGRSSPDNVQS